MWAWTSVVAIAVLSVSPPPRELRVEEEGHFYVRAGISVVLSDSLYAERATLLAPLLAAVDGSLLVESASDAGRFSEGICIGTAADPGPLDRRKLRRYLDGAGDLGEEGYRLAVEKNGIVLAAGGVRGVWNGLQTLSAFLEEYGPNLPYLSVRDWPALEVRGVYVTGLPSEADLQAYGRLKCTHVFVASEDFYDLSGVRAETWRRAFEHARANYLEPVPVFSTLQGMESFLRGHPLMVEGRAVSERITLSGVEWSSLRYPNILAEHPEELAVTISGVPCLLGKDYLIESVPLVAPFLPERPKWRIRREVEGAIPDGAEVAVRYGFATADSGTLCYASPVSRAWLDSALTRLVTELRPRYIHVDHGSVGRLNKDPRTLAMGLDNAAFFVLTAERLAAAIHGIDPSIEIMMWSDLVNPYQSARTYGLENVTGYLPDAIQRLGRLHITTPADAVARFEQLQPVVTAPGITLIDGPPSAAGALFQRIAEHNSDGGGIIAPGVTPEASEPLLAIAWSGLGEASIWTRCLNRHFDVALGQPDFATIRGTLVRYLNDATLRGESPKEARRRFDEYCGQHLDVLHEDEAGYLLVKNALGLLSDYLILEEQFSASGTEGTLRQLRQVIADWKALEPDADGERYQRIQETIDNQQLFVPATILFQEDLRYFRKDQPPHAQYEIPALPEYVDTSNEATATITSLAGQASVRRIDFESVRPVEVVLDGGDGVGAFDVIQRWTGPELAGVRGPLLFPPAPHAALRLTARHGNAAAVLRDVRLYGAKEPAVLDCAYAAQAPPMAATFEARVWPATPQAGAFLQKSAPLFAEAPTAVRACRTRGDLYIGIQAGEPRPDAIVADFTQRDAPLWQQESVELWIQPAGRLPLRLIVNPLGAQYDSEANDGGWDGEWSVVTERTETGWNAVVRIPVEWLGEVKRGGSLPFNVVRNRFSVSAERSAWAHDFGASPDLQWGTLRFP